MTLGVQIRIARPITLNPEAMIKGVRAAVGETTQILEAQIGKLTPEGVGGTRTGLKASIFSEVREQGTRITGITGSEKAYAMPVNYGRRPGQKAPPYKSLLEWVGLRFGVSDPKQQQRLAFLIARSIGKRGTKAYRDNSPPGVRMFERGLDVAEPLIVQSFERMLGDIGPELIRS